MNDLIVIECIEDGSIESDIIGVASDMEKAKEMMWEYFGDKLIVGPNANSQPLMLLLKPCSKENPGMK